ncbi:CapA family protein [Amycolatopsis sp. NPDC047767]|uniref:CapA family protein n=1 Tax=Amycolatopsis sp. NPDC047767 TaxID=3156765 RepID=UPI003454059F
MSVPDPIRVIATGELMLCMEDDPEPYFEPTAPYLRAADAVIGHLEFLHTTDPQPAWDNRLPAPHPDKLRGLLTGNVTAVTLAGNPAYTYGPPGVTDTLAWLDEHGIAHTGAGHNIDEAVEPAILELNGTTVGLLSYDCIGVEANAATPTKPGVAYVDVITHYEPGRITAGPPQIYTWPEPWSLEAMREEIRALRGKCDVVMVGIHMGLVHFAAARNEIRLADYEPAVARAAIEAGADVVLGNHAHVLKGVEFYRGKPIFYCLGNFVTAFPWEAHFAFRREPLTTRMRSRLRERPGSAADHIDPAYPNYPFPPESRKAMLATIDLRGGAVSRLGLVPCLIDPHGVPVPVSREAGGEDVVGYLRKATEGAGLNAKFDWDGDEVVITES